MKLSSLKASAFAAIFWLAGQSVSQAQQAVSGIITDYNGFWKTRVGNVNSIKPQNSHNLLAFTYKNVQYSTGVNDGLLTSRGEAFTPGDFWGLPIAHISGTINSNTKVGLGQLYDGVHNGASNPAPDGDIITYLTDGIKGLNIGTCIANLPAGSMSFFVSNIKPEHIGDGIPDIIVTQVADPSNSHDRYAFTDAAGNIIGVSKEIVFTNITPVANWTADFYEASRTPMTLSSEFVNTDRPMRLWAADLSDFGITAANYSSIQRFRINLSGNSDVAFVAYNNRTFSVNSNVLPVKWKKFSGQAENGRGLLKWETASEANTAYFVVEKSTDNIDFTELGTVNAAGFSDDSRHYSYIDPALQPGMQWYRLRQVDRDGRSVFSATISLRMAGNDISISLYPNPATDLIRINHPAANSTTIRILDAAGRIQRQVRPQQGSPSTTIPLNGLTTGVYFLQYESGTETITRNFLKQ